jgi:hypothetical protein
VKTGSQQRTLQGSESRSRLLPTSQANLHPVFLCERWDDTVQVQVLDKLSIVVGDVEFVLFHGIDPLVPDSQQ